MQATTPPPPPPPQHVLNEMRQQLELATTKCGSLLQQLDIVKDRVRKSSSTSLLDTVENDNNMQEDSVDNLNDNSTEPVKKADNEDNREEEKKEISNDYQDLSVNFNKEIKEILEDDSRSVSNKNNATSKSGKLRIKKKVAARYSPPKSSSSESSHKSMKSKQDIIDLFFKRLENMDNCEEQSNSVYSITSRAFDNIENLSYDEGEDEGNDDGDDIDDDDDDIGDFLSSIIPTDFTNATNVIEEASTIDEKSKFEANSDNENMSQDWSVINEVDKNPKNNENTIAKKRQKPKKPKVPNKLPLKLSPYQTSMVKIANKPNRLAAKRKPSKKKLTSKKLKKDDKNVAPVNDIVCFMKKVMSKKELNNEKNSLNSIPIKSINKKDDLIKNIPFAKPANLSNKSRDIKRSKSVTSSAFMRDSPKIEQAKNRTTNIIAQNKKIFENKKTAENNKKILEQRKNLTISKPQVVSNDMSKGNNKDKNKDKTKENEKKEGAKEGSGPVKLISSLVEKLKNITKHQEQRSLIENGKKEENPIEGNQNNKDDKTSLVKPPPQMKPVKPKIGGPIIKNDSSNKTQHVKNDVSNKILPLPLPNKIHQDQLHTNRVGLPAKHEILPAKANLPIKTQQQNKSFTNTQSKIAKDMKLKDSKTVIEPKQINKPLQPRNEMVKKIGIFEHKYFNQSKVIPNKIQKTNDVLINHKEIINPKNVPKETVNHKHVIPKETIHKEALLKEIIANKKKPLLKCEENNKNLSSDSTIFQQQIGKKFEYDQSIVPKTAASSFPPRYHNTVSKNNLVGENIVDTFNMPAFNNRVKSDKCYHSPVRFNSIPFIVGQSTSKSYHIGLNIQQTLSLFKLTPSMTSLNEINSERSVSEKSAAFTIFTTPSILQEKFRRQKTCPACIHQEESEDEDNDGDPWAIPQKDGDQRSGQFSQCNCLPKKLISFHEVLSQLFQSDNKLYTKYQNYFVNSIPTQNEDDTEKLKELVADSQKSAIPYRQNNTFYFTKLLRSIQKLQDTFVK